MQILYNYRNHIRSAKFFLLILLLVFSTLLCGCLISPVAFSKPGGSGRPTIKKDARAALFTFLVRGVSVSRSQGTAFPVVLTDADAHALKARSQSILSNFFSLLEVSKIKDHPLIQAGSFPVQEQFFKNPDAMPIAATSKDQETMARTAAGLKCDYLIVMLLDHSTTKLALQPSSVKAVVQLQIFTPDAGLIYSSELEASDDALPYDRSIPMTEFVQQYQSVLRNTALRLMNESLAEMEKKMKSEIQVRPTDSESENEQN